MKKVLVFIFFILISGCEIDKDNMIIEAKDHNSTSNKQKLILSKIKKNLEEILSIIND